jgi:hypothetical protein
MDSRTQSASVLAHNTSESAAAILGQRPIKPSRAALRIGEQ